MEATAEKSGQAEQRAQKKATRRAAFIQEVAEAVYSLGVQRRNEIEVKQRIVAQADEQARATREQLAEAQLAFTSPIEALYCQNHDVEHLVREDGWVERRTKWALDWAINEGILPTNTTRLPEAEAQFLALAPWQLQSPPA